MYGTLIIQRIVCFIFFSLSATLSLIPSLNILYLNFFFSVDTWQALL